MGACTAGLRGCCGHDTRLGEYEFADIVTDPNSRLTLTGKPANNAALVKHIRSTVAKFSLSSAEDLGTRVKALDHAVHYAQLLKLKVISGNLLPGSEINVTAQGLENGCRGERDGVTYFGCKKRSWKSGIRTRQGEIINDVVIKLREKDIGQLYRGRHFKISYSLDRNAYRIKDMGVGFGTYAKIDKPMPVKDNYLVMLGDSFLILNLIQDTSLTGKLEGWGEGADAKMRLKVTVFAPTANGEIFYFSPTKQTIKVGRLNACEIQIEDNLMSKFQAHVTYTPEKGWLLVDGWNGRASTNGTWLYLMEEYDMYNGMVIKAVQTLFHVTLQ